MADISMCEGQGCAIRDRCYRHTAAPSQGQSWAAFWEHESFRPESGCNLFLDTRLAFKRREGEE